MGIADPEAALEKLREFRHLLVTDESALRAGGQQTARVPRSELQPLVEQIARELDPEGVQHLGGTWNNMGQRWIFGGAITATDRLIGILQKREEYERIFNGEGRISLVANCTPGFGTQLRRCGMAATTSLLCMKQPRLWSYERS